MNKKLIGIMIGVILLPTCVLGADAQEIFDQASELLQMQRYRDAIAAYELFIYEHPDHHLAPAAKWAMANIYFTIDADYPKAALIYQNIISKHPDTGWEIFSIDRLGMCYEEEEKWADAADLYERGLQRLNAESQASLSQEWTGVFKTRLLAAYRNMNDTESMIRIFEESLASDPAAPSAPQDQFDLGMVYLEMNEPTKAAENFASLVDRYPFSQPARRVQNEYAELMTTELAYDWASFDTFQSSVRLSQTGHFEEARQGFDEVIARKQGTAMEHAARFQKGLLAFRQNGDAASLREKLTVPGEYPYGFGGVNATRFLQLLDGIVQAKAAISENPEDVGAYSGMAFTFYQLQAFHPAIEAYKQAISITPDNTVLHNMLGYCYIGAEAFDDAIEAFQQLIEISPEDPNSYDSMAEAYYVMGDTARAVDYYQQSLSIDSSFTNPYYMLGEIHHGAGKYDEARVYLERYVDLDPEGFRAEAAQNLLREMDEEQ